MALNVFLAPDGLVATDETIDAFAQILECRAKELSAAPELLAALKEVERHCPCGARPESPRTHPHVGGCPVGEAIAKYADTTDEKGEAR
jgi:hypothetical protein